MDALIVVALFFQKFGTATMVVAWVAIGLVYYFKSRRKFTSAGWAGFAVMILSGILALPQIVLGMVFSDMALLVFGVICAAAAIFGWKVAHDSGIWHRFGRRRPKKAPKKTPRKPWMN